MYILGAYVQRLSGREELVNSAIVVTVILIAAVVVLVGVALALRRRRALRSREEAREEFGPEYERVAEERGSDREAEEEIRGRRKEVGGRMRPLSENSRERYEEQWEEVERAFLNNPVGALEMADRTVYDIMRERNFPVDERGESEETARDIGAVQPGIADDYREARRIRYSVTRGGRGSNDTTEEMRQAIQRYRSVYERLVE